LGRSATAKKSVYVAVMYAYVYFTYEQVCNVSMHVYLDIWLAVHHSVTFLLLPT
jgi:hypothetical protein